MTSPDLLHVETYGDPVLAVHGITGSGGRFERTAELIPERRWICPDLRGHGEMCRPLPSLPETDVLLVEADPEHTSVNDGLRAALQAGFDDRLRRVVVPDATHVLFRTELEGTAAAVRPFFTG